MIRQEKLHKKVSKFFLTRKLFFLSIRSLKMLLTIPQSFKSMNGNYKQFLLKKTTLHKILQNSL